MTLAFPESDTHFPRQDGYQEGIIDRALPYCKKKDLAIDVGAHVGLLSRKMLKSGFGHIVCFEPQPENYACLEQNVDKLRAITMPFAASDKHTMLCMENPAPGNSGAWECRPAYASFDVVAVPIDSFGFEPDLMKYDIQGHELLALRGSQATLLEHKPVVIVECWRDGKRDNAPRCFMEDLGAELVETVGKDLIFAWK